MDLYYNRRDWISNFDVPEGATLDEVILRQLRTGDYGRCVFRCDNDVVDHQIVSMEMENDVTISFSMDAFTLGDQRETHIRLTHGEIDGDERILRVRRFRGGEEQVYDFSGILGKPFHAGADLNRSRISSTRSAAGSTASAHQSENRSKATGYASKPSEAGYPDRP